MIALILMTALIVTALQITQLLTLMFVIRINWGSVLVRKTMPTELATFVKMSTMISLIALNVTALQITQ